MVKFIIGLFIGVIIGFVVCAIFSVSHTDECKEDQFANRMEEENAETK